MSYSPAAARPAGPETTFLSVGQSAAEGPRPSLVASELNASLPNWEGWIVCAKPDPSEHEQFQWSGVSRGGKRLHGEAQQKQFSQEQILLDEEVGRTKNF